MLMHTDYENIPGHLILVDFEKAFDTISHNFIWQVPNCWGLTTIVLIGVNYHTTTQPIVLWWMVINPTSLTLVEVVDKGTPLTLPTYFVCSNVSDSCLKQSRDCQVVRWNWSNIHDDTDVITDGSELYFNNVMTCLEAFYILCKIKVNYDKTSILSNGSQRFAKGFTMKGFDGLVWFRRMFFLPVDNFRPWRCIDCGSKLL